MPENTTRRRRERPVLTTEELRIWRSRLSHHLGRMERRGLIHREECATDNRGAEVVLDQTGADAFRRASVPHPRAVRELFVDALTPTQLMAAGELAGALRARPRERA